MLTIERSLNVYAAGIPQIINLSQYDDDFQLVFILYTSEGTFTVPSGTTAEVMGTKTDGNGYSADAAISGNAVTVTGNVQMTACAGRNVFEVVLTNSGKRLATLNFILQVERAAMDADTIQSETVLKELNAIIDGADQAEAAAARAEDAADTIDETVADLKEDLSQKAPAIYNASDDAEVVTFADGADDMPMKSVVLKLVPHQEGTGDPSPSNVRPISGYTSVNVYQNTSQSLTGATTYPITLPQTVYGGELDVTNGVLKVTWALVDLGTLTWSYNTSNSQFYSNVVNNALSTSAEVDAPVFCTKYPYDRRTYGSYSAEHTRGLIDRRVYVVTTATTDADVFKNSVNGTYLAYTVATPTEITLDPTTIKTLLGTNTIWMSADGTIQAEYCADTKLYIDALTAPDDDMIANSNIPSGKYFTVNNRLYISTSAIAQGEAIVVGTNCTQTDLATALNALNS